MKKKITPINFFRPTISKKDLIAVLECLIEENISKNQIANQLSQELSRFFGGLKSTFLTNNTPSALYLILNKIGLKKKQEVILSPLAPHFVHNLIVDFGAHPIYVDIGKNNLVMDKKEIEKKINEKTKVIIVSHILGFPSPTAELDFPKTTVLIEDITNALGTKVNHQAVGKVGDYSFFSLDHDKIITAAQGGGIFTKKQSYLELVKSIKKKDVNSPATPLSLEFRLSDLNASLALSEISLIKKFISKRKEIATYYDHSIEKSQHSLYPFPFQQQLDYNYSFYPFFSKQPFNQIKSIFIKHKIELKSIDNGTIWEYHLNNNEKKKLKNISSLKKKLVLIPLYPTLQKEEIERIGKLLMVSG